ncbi:hypothetical protein ACJX0J_034628, partial [Zea mays]
MDNNSSSMIFLFSAMIGVYDSSKILICCLFTKYVPITSLAMLILAIWRSARPKVSSLE